MDGGVGERLVSGCRREWSGDGRNRLLKIRDEIALEAADETLRVPARGRRVPRLIVRAQSRAGVAGRGRPCETVEVGRAGDEAVRHEDEQN